MKLAVKLSLFVFISSMIGIILMSVSFYQVSKSFYKTQLQNDIEYRMKAHREVIEEDMSEHTLHHVVLMEKRGPNTSFIIFDSGFQFLESNYPIPTEQLALYKEWLEKNSKAERTEFVETIAHHLPHIWSLTPLEEDGRVVGYLFIDQDTGEFELAKTKLLAISVIMGVFTLLLSAVITVYLSKKLTSPLIKVRNSTRKIAKGEFDVDLSPRGNDEIADLMNHISSMAEQLKEYRDSRQQFLSNVSHDLRTPLTYIKAYAALLKEEKSSTEKDIKEHSTIIHSEAIRMERLVNDLFQLMKLDEGNFTIVKQEIDFSSLVANTLQKVKVNAEEKKVELIFIATDKIIANVDGERMEQVILNLVTNSLRSTKPGGNIEAILKQNSTKVILQIKDSGQGIPEEDLPFIWDRFYRVDKSRSSKTGGSGLGLSIIRQLIELHNGEISVKSRLGEGTVFTITLNKD
ncbi:sensor histidine kinase [Halalkalibacter alkalisediminis]|uniref:histidine kinase n=1 Tax=Halalkalibacter alkalisediminis TaxID=935616 RepID=A0ABV6NQW3_9BACI|nr:sensor histidine kinase [Halalkalibacter alkalisediminis]